jgi:hypothetical protein
MVIPVVWHTAYQSPNSDLWEFGGERLSRDALFCSLRLLRIGQWPQTGNCVTNRFIVVDFGICPLCAISRHCSLKFWCPLYLKADIRSRNRHVRGMNSV